MLPKWREPQNIVQAWLSNLTDFLFFCYFCSVDEIFFSDGETMMVVYNC